jgi:hypothetical protein
MDDRTERRADDDADRQIDDVAAHREFFKFFQHDVASLDFKELQQAPARARGKASESLKGFRRNESQPLGFQCCAAVMAVCEAAPQSKTCKDLANRGLRLFGCFALVYVGCALLTEGVVDRDVG